MKELFFVNEEIRSYEKVIIYGVGKAGKALLLKLLQRDVKVECFADADPEKCGVRVLNIPVTHINELACHREDAAMLVSGLYAFPVARELEKRGFRHIFLDYGNEVNLIHLEREG